MAPLLSEPEEKMDFDDQLSHLSLSDDDINAAVESLYKDRQRPYGHILQKRLEESTGTCINIYMLQSLCQSNTCLQYIQHDDEFFYPSSEGSDWFVLLRNRQSCFQDMTKVSTWSDSSEVMNHDSSISSTPDGSIRRLCQDTPEAHCQFEAPMYTFVMLTGLVVPAVLATPPPMAWQETDRLPAQLPVQSSASADQLEPDQPLLTPCGSHARRVSMLGFCMTNKKFKLKRTWEPKRVKCLETLGIDPLPFPQWNLPKLPCRLKDWNEHEWQQWREFQWQWQAIKPAYIKCKVQWEGVQSKMRELGYPSFELPQLLLPSTLDGEMTKECGFQQAYNELRKWMQHGTEPEKITWKML
eukprot:TRINITY_DN53689_c0_g1_i1.p1 TRINITY_DN53689_c0_g1~~TRINITY_DN53689_c0_g1_i1.p1  ORF type:complete len:355 (+),score=51.05 TRINITY_DN53689_c0_g1_i1:65-1129(+)